ncbi:hypothetical protein RhiJN_02665 [Ceratobasidium sp. AG-Ba]|nr:hypothetical protein RhiJN_02665 [Ceratobasidium sp. AG-Ba]
MCVVPYNDMDSPRDSDGVVYDAGDDEVYDPESQEQQSGRTFRDLLDEVVGSDDPFYDENDDKDDLPPSSQVFSSQSDNETHRTLNALSVLADMGVTLSGLLSDVLFGDGTIQAHELVVSARKDVFNSSTLPTVLDRIRSPPGMRVRAKSHKNARTEIDEWAVKTSTEILRKELVTYAVTTTAPETETEIVSEESLQEMTFNALAVQVEQHAPRLRNLLTEICLAKRRNRERKRDSSFAVIIFINSLANQISRLNNRMQKLVCIYFKAKGVPKSVYYLFYRCGISESYQWSVNALSNISDAAMDKATQVFQDECCLLIHDNLRLPFEIKHQRTDHLSVTDNGTAMTMMPLRDSVRAAAILRNPQLWADKKAELTRMYRSSQMRHLKAADIYAMDGFIHERERTISNLICFLFDTPTIRHNKDIKKSGKRDHAQLAEMNPVCQVPYGPEHRNRQYMLRSIPQEEASYGGNYVLTREVPRQLGILSDEALETWARNQRTPWLGDMLTILRLRMLALMKAEDLNTLERLEHIIPTWAWFHLDMNIRAGLTKPTKKKGPEYHTGDEFLKHTTTARMRELWLWVSNTSTIEDLADWVRETSPHHIRLAAEKIWKERASNRAIQTYRSTDPSLCNAIALNRDLLLRHEVKTATQHGDVGRMERTLPLLLIFFLGAGATNYAKEVSETLHWQKYEAPPGVAELIRDECWVLNTQGQADTFYPFDLRQELNNLSIKEHGPPPQGCTWEAHSKWAPALPVFTAVVQHVDECFHDFYRSRKHYVPDPEPDIALLMLRHAERKIFEKDSEHPSDEPEKRTVDCWENGVTKLSKGYLDKLAQERTQYLAYRSNLEIYERDGHSDEQIINLIKRDSISHTKKTSWEWKKRK